MDKPFQMITRIVIEPANCDKKKVTPEGLRVHIEPSHPAKHKRNWPVRRYMRPCIPLFHEARAPCTSYL